MSADPSRTYVASIQRRALRAALVVAVLLVLLVAPLIVSGSLRLNLAHRFGLVPDVGVESIASANSGDLLITIPVFTDTGSGRAETRYHAAYIAHPVSAGYDFASLDGGATITVPLEQLDLIAADDAGVYLLLVRQRPQPERYLLTIASGTLTPLGDDVALPDVPATWERSIYATRIGRNCNGVSPGQRWIACFRSPSFSRYLAGDWQIDLSRYGAYQSTIAVYRGAGTQPIFGFTADDAWLYFQNETGTWRVPVSDDMFGT